MILRQLNYLEILILKQIKEYICKYTISNLITCEEIKELNIQINSLQQFKLFYSIFQQQYDKIYFQNISKNDLKVFRDKCRLCVHNKMSSHKKLLIHILLQHSSNYNFKFTTYLTEKHLIIQYLQINQNQINTQFNGENWKFAQIIKKKSLAQYFLLTFYSQNTFQFEECNFIPNEKNKFITQLIDNHQFYSGPQSNFQKIQSVKDFKTKDQKDYRFLKENENECLLSSVPELKGTSMFEFMQLYNNKVMEQQPTNLYIFLQQFLNLTGDMAICFQNHLFTMLCYHMINNQQFVDLSIKIKK